MAREKYDELRQKYFLSRKHELETLHGLKKLIRRVQIELWARPKANKGQGRITILSWPPADQRKRDGNYQ